MSDLTFREKQQFERLLNMQSGYVLDFSDRTFREFVIDSTGCDILGSRYDYRSGSKANRLRKFWIEDENRLVGKLMADLLEYGSETNAFLEQKALLLQCRDIAGRLRGSTEVISAMPAPAVPVGATLEALRADFFKLSQMEAHKRGYAFERALNEIFHVFALSPRSAFRLVGEQIDGSFSLSNVTYLVEAKWTALPIGADQLMYFAEKVRRKALWSRGLFISYGGYSIDGLEAFGRGQATSIVCMDGADLGHVLYGQVDLRHLIEAKVRRAVESGNAFVPARELFLDLI